ncbi:hypothetical protein PanNE5_29890 [Pandoraea sp. NE5]|uniref:hypothetical protein n=1 Tax=Pandoraea sp. NE5 TaxID=2904129 RepID=UPI0021C3F3E3|nr:hypothetical protein [Pandoraea sp. NE5]BDD93549.1 hypothetical protein PanNE5_29890 [Pandoraea sp. NE5]
MVTTQFQQMKDPITMEVQANVIRYTDDDGGVWTVPRGHRFWDIYEQWLSAGNSPLPAA